MSLDNIQLQPISIQELFKESLVQLKSSNVELQTATTPAFNILGKNLNNIIIVVNNNDVAFVEDEELNFLLGILNACKLNMDDVGILNISKYPSIDYKKISVELHAEKILLFGVTPDELSLPLSFPNYQVQAYNNQVYLSSPVLSRIQHDKTEKTKLWNCLRQIFSI